MFSESVKIKDVKLEIGKLVRSLRKRENISQEQLAELLELSRITIRNLESGKNATADTLLKVLQHFELLAPLHQLIINTRDENEQVESLY
ncbi:hypothetical protein D3C71_1787560 [compost metagenome]